MSATSDLLIERVQKYGWLSVGCLYFDNSYVIQPFTTCGHVAISPSKELIFADGKYDNINSEAIGDYLFWNDHYINYWQTITVVGFDMLQHFDINLFQGEHMYKKESGTFPVPELPSMDEIDGIVLDPVTGIADGYSIGETIDKKQHALYELYPKEDIDNAVSYRIKEVQEFNRKHKLFLDAISSYVGITDCI